jgi:enoyl-CoA hydratase/carnithine racemase
MALLTTERSDRVLVVRVDNPPHNFMNREMVAELDQLTRSLDGDRSVGSVVITGAPEQLFITHYDVAEILAGATEVGFVPGPRLAGGLLRATAAVKRVPGLRAAAQRTPLRGLMELHQIHDIFLRMNRSDKVFIAAINGPATGGGCELALACDLRLVADGPIPIGLPEMTMGFNPGAGGTQRLSRLIGPGPALEMMLEGRTLQPHEAKEARLVHRVLPPDRLLPDAIETGARLARRAPNAIRGLKRLVHEASSGSLAAGLAAERKWFMTEAGAEQALREMSAYVAEVERLGPAWTDPDAMPAWQEGTAADRS